MKFKSAKGFSLIEILIVIAIIAILGAIAMPTFNKFRDNTNLKEAVGALMGDLQLARQSAIMSNVNFTVTLNTSGDTSYTIQGGTYNRTQSIGDFGSGSKIYSQNFPSKKVTFLPRGILAETGGPYQVLIRNNRDSCIHVNVSNIGKVSRTIHRLQ